MQNNTEFGLIGKSLKHSFSKGYFEKKFQEQGLNGYTYSNFEIPVIEDFKKIITEHPQLQGLNVTIPYKESIIPFLNELSDEAKEIGAVNCIRVEGNKLIGFNTDTYGFAQSIKPFLDNTHERALILGTGGASKAVAYALKKTGVDVYYVSTSPKKNDHSLHYTEINERVMEAFKLIINTTPLGMSPREDECPALPYRLFTPAHLAYDVIYNPAETLFLKKAKDQGALIMNGLSMLQLQAEKNWEIWNQTV
jgi:shikimate dehydrogenase